MEVASDFGLLQSCHLSFGYSGSAQAIQTVSALVSSNSIQSWRWMLFLFSEVFVIPYPTGQ